ncbi:MAG: hypothetical protein KatS3mg118_3234 [Paracoccaceae bacterium]|nr:MAG: hypothetical protein KatS3mg118_3234 [Paracoccaceae bacterium]
MAHNDATTFSLQSLGLTFDPNTLAGALELGGLFLAVGLVLHLIVGRLFGFLVAHDKDGRIDRLTAVFLKRMVQVLVWVFVATLYAKTVPALDRMGTALLASVSIGYGSDIDRARAVLLELARAHPLAEEVVGCPMTMLGGSSVDFTLRARCKDAGDAASLRHDLLEQIKKRFDAEGIEIPYARQNVVLHRPEKGSQRPRQEHEDRPQHKHDHPGQKSP